MTLKNEREEKRREIANRKLDQQFKASCDQYRALKSLQKTAIAVSADIDGNGRHV